MLKKKKKIDRLREDSLHRLETPPFRAGAQCFIMRIDPKMNTSAAQHEPEGQKGEIFVIILPFTSSQKSWFVKHCSGSLKPTPAFDI